MLSETIFEGRLVKDPFSGKTENGKNFTSFNLAVPRNYKNPVTGNYDADFFSVTVWGKSATYIQENCKKGTPILVVGRLTTYDRQNDEGQKIKMITLNAREIYIISQKLETKADEIEKTETSVNQ